MLSLSSVLDYDAGVQASRTYTPLQLAFATIVVIVFAVLTYTEKVSGDATIALVSGITGAVLAAPLAAKASNEEARANGIKEGAEAATVLHEAGDAGTTVVSAPAVVVPPPPRVDG